MIKIPVTKEFAAIYGTDPVALEALLLDAAARKAVPRPRRRGRFTPIESPIPVSDDIVEIAHRIALGPTPMYGRIRSIVVRWPESVPCAVPAPAWWRSARLVAPKGPTGGGATKRRVSVPFDAPAWARLEAFAWDRDAPIERVILATVREGLATVSDNESRRSRNPVIGTTRKWANAWKTLPDWKRDIIQQAINFVARQGGPQTEIRTGIPTEDVRTTVWLPGITWPQNWTKGGLFAAAVAALDRLEDAASFAALVADDAEIEAPLAIERLREEATTAAATIVRAAERFDEIQADHARALALDASDVTAAKVLRRIDAAAATVAEALELEATAQVSNDIQYLVEANKRIEQCRQRVYGYAGQIRKVSFRYNTQGGLENVKGD